MNSVRKQIRINVIKRFKEDDRMLRKKNKVEAELMKHRGKKMWKKHPPLKRTRSFTEAGMKFEDALDVKRKFIAR